MPSKISNFPTSSTPALNDLIPIVDVSETNTANQNKKVTVETLLNLNNSSQAVPTQIIKLRRITTSQSLSADTLTAVLFNQAVLSPTGTSIGSFNTTTGRLTLISTGKYNFTGYLTFNSGVIGTRAIFYAEDPSTGSFDTTTRLSSATISQEAGTFMLPINFNLEITTAPVVFTFITASSTVVSIASANSTLSTYAESQITIVKLN